MTPGWILDIAAAVAGAVLAPAPAAAAGTGTSAAAFAGTAGNGAGPAGTVRVVGGGPDAVPAALGARETLLSPGMTVACRIAMGATMAFMLLIMT